MAAQVHIDAVAVPEQVSLVSCMTQHQSRLLQGEHGRPGYYLRTGCVCRVQWHALIRAAGGGAVRRRARSTLLRGVHQGGLEEHFDRVVHALEAHAWVPLDRFGGV